MPDIDRVAAAFFDPPPSLQRRCQECSTALTPADRVDGERLYVCPACQARVRPAAPRCPVCLGFATLGDDELLCRAGCQPLALPHQEPRAGWELALAEMLPAAHEDLWGDPWGVAGMHAVAWDSYSSPHSRLQLRWGAPTYDGRERAWMEPDGREDTSQEGARLAAVLDANTTRCHEIGNALRAFGAAVLADCLVGRRGVYHSDAVVPCAVAGGLAYGTIRWQAATGSAAALAARHQTAAAGETRETALACFWGESGSRWQMLRTVGAALVIELYNAIVRRGGSFADLEGLVRQLGSPRDTPFGGYRHAVAFWCGDHGATLLGWGSALASLGGARPKFRLPAGPQFGGRMAVSPSHSGTAGTRNATVWAMEQDVEACVDAARVGGRWSEPEADDPPEAARTCEGGRPLAPWELRLVALCDHGVSVGQAAGAAAKPGKNRPQPAGATGDTWRALSVLEAVDRLRAEGAQRRHDPGWAPARHLTTQAGKAALRAARKALREALEAWGLVPPRPPAAERQRAPRPPDAPPAVRAPVARHELVCNTWDMEAPR